MFRLIGGVFSSKNVSNEKHKKSILSVSLPAVRRVSYPAIRRDFSSSSLLFSFLLSSRFFFFFSFFLSLHFHLHLFSSSFSICFSLSFYHVLLLLLSLLFLCTQRNGINMTNDSTNEERRCTMTHGIEKELTLCQCFPMSRHGEVSRVVVWVETHSLVSRARICD